MQQFQQKYLETHKHNGFILPLVLIVTLILGAGMMATTTQARLGLTGAVRQSRARSAREVAEAGSAFPTYLRHSPPSGGGSSW